MNNATPRWQQRFDNYQRALQTLGEAVALAATRPLSQLEQQGLIKAFEYVHELAWNTLKDFYENQGETNIQGSKDVSRLAFQRGLIDNGELWMDMIGNRNLTTHTYNQETADKISTAVIEGYYAEFEQLRERLQNQMGA